MGDGGEHQQGFNPAYGGDGRGGNEGGGAASTGDSGTGSGLQPQDLIRGLLQDLSETVGVVHLALHTAAQASCPPAATASSEATGADVAAGGDGNSAVEASSSSGAGLVLQWSREVFAVVEPSGYWR